MEQPLMAYLISLGRLHNKPLFEVMMWPYEEIIRQQAYDLMQTDEFKNRYEMERQESLTLEQRFNEIEV